MGRSFFSNVIDSKATKVANIFRNVSLAKICQNYLAILKQGFNGISHHKAYKQLANTYLTNSQLVRILWLICYTYVHTFLAKGGIKSCRFCQHFYCSKYDVSQLAIRQISHCWQIHDFCLVSLFFIVVINPYSFFKFIIFNIYIIRQSSL